MYCSHFVESRACSVLGRYPRGRRAVLLLSFSRQGGVDVNVLHVTCEFSQMCELSHHVRAQRAHRQTGESTDRLCSHSTLDDTMAHAHTRSCQLILVAREAQWVCERPTGGPGRASVQIVLRDVGIELLLRYPVRGLSRANLAVGLVRRCVASKPGCSERYQWWSRSSTGFGQRNLRYLAQVLRGARHSLDMATRPRDSALRTRLGTIGRAHNS